MNGTKDHHAEQNKPSSKDKILYVLTNLQKLDVK
jgi:hypothetical protein